MFSFFMRSTSGRHTWGIKWKQISYSVQNTILQFYFQSKMIQPIKTKTRKTTNLDFKGRKEGLPNDLTENKVFLKLFLT